MGFEGLDADAAAALPDAAAMNILTAERAQIDQGLPLLQQPEWVKNDCICRGGRWVGDDTGYCLPSNKPTGKYYDVGSRQCLPLGGAALGGSRCKWRGVNVCVVGAILAGGVVLWLLLRKKKPTGGPSATATH
jgi:hypothetical protein